MSPEDIQQQIVLEDKLASLAWKQRQEQTQRMWHAASRSLPWVVAFFTICGMGVIGLVSFKIMSDAWLATHWF